MSADRGRLSLNAAALGPQIRTRGGQPCCQPAREWPSDVWECQRCGRVWFREPAWTSGFTFIIGGYDAEEATKAR